MNKVPDLHKDPVLLLIYKMTTPLMISGFVTTSYGIIDMIFASRLGSVEVASIAFITPLLVILQALGIGVVRGGISIIATLLGQQDNTQASAYATQLRILTLLLSFIISIPFIFLLPLLLNFADVPPELFKQSLIYSNIILLSIPLALFFQLYVSFFKSQGKMKIISKIFIFGVISKAFLNGIFIFRLDFEIDGLAYASLLSQFSQMLIVIMLFKISQHDFSLGWKTVPEYSKYAIWKKLLMVGLPLSMSQASSHFGFLVLNVFIVQFSHHAVAAFAIGNQINSLLFSTSKQIGHGLVPLLAQNWGRGSIDRVKEIIRLGIMYSAAFGIFAAVMIQIIKYPIASFLSNGDTVVYQHIINYIGLVGWTVIAWSISHTLQGVFNSFQKTQFALMVDIVRLWCIRIPGVMIFYYLLPSTGEYGIWYTMFISNIIALLFAAGYFLKKVKPMIGS